jgi:cytidine deaminase
MAQISAEAAKVLVQLALGARQNSYSPYSHYAVGAALRARSGRVFIGVNVENAAYPQTLCAERTAVASAIAAGEREFEAIAVASKNGGSPCGGCRQVLAEFGLDIQVILANETGEIVMRSKVGDLLPGAFTLKHLPAGQ